MIDLSVIYLLLKRNETRELIAPMSESALLVTAPGIGQSEAASLVIEQTRVLTLSSRSGMNALKYTTIVNSAHLIIIHVLNIL